MMGSCGRIEGIATDEGATMNVKQLKAIIANMPDDAPVLLSTSDYNYKEAWLLDDWAVYRADERAYEEFAGDWLLVANTEKVQALCLY